MSPEHRLLRHRLNDLREAATPSAEDVVHRALS